MDNNFIKKYSNAVFGYCIKRLNNIDDAKDLSQEILLEVIKSLRSSQVDNLDAWVWKIAHNRYARFIGNKKIVTVSLDDSGIIETLADESEFFEDNSDEINAIFTAIHSIAKSHRDILIDFYISGLSYEQIANKHKLPVNTVKTRLFYGKQKLKERWQKKVEERKVFNKINWYICGNGRNNPYEYLDRQFARAITTVCYEKALSVEEISLATGIPCMFIEDELPKLLYGEILAETNGKYVSNIIIYSEALTQRIENLLFEYRDDLSEKVEAILTEYDISIRDICFYGYNKPDNHIRWYLIPIVMREACEEARRLNGKVGRIPYPPRKDGGSGWIFVNVSENSKHKYFSGCNGYYRDNILTYYWSSKYFSEEINNYLAKLEDTGLESDADIAKLNDVMIANGIKYNIIEKVNGQYKWLISVFTKEQIMRFNTLKIDMAKPLAKALLPAVDKIYNMMLSEIPKHLHDQIKGVFGAELNSVIAMVCDRLEMQGKLISPKDEYFTEQIIMTIK